MQNQNKNQNKNQAEKIAFRQILIAQRGAMKDRLKATDALQNALRIWLFDQPDAIIGAYWPIKGEFDPLPALYRWQEDANLHNNKKNIPTMVLSVTQPQADHTCKIGLPVVDKVKKTLAFHAWYPGCPMEEDAYGIPKPKNTELVIPTLLLVPCVGFGDNGYRLGYGGGFYDRTLATLKPQPRTIGLCFQQSHLADFQPEMHDVPLHVILTEQGVQWQI